MSGIIFKSFRKSWKLRKINKVLGKPTDVGNFGSEEYFEQSAKKTQALDDLIDMCFEYDFLKAIADEYGVERNRLKDIYWRLCANGAGQWHKGHFVAASALVFPESLKMCLENKGSLRDLAMRLIEYFD